MNANLISQIDITEHIQSYPAGVQKKLLGIRELVVDTAKADDVAVTECLKWGEISYTSKQGSTLRMGYKEKSPNNLYVFFHCQTKLVDTFRELASQRMLSDKLAFEGNRAIVLSMAQKLPTESLKTCISMTLNYHTLKHLPLLGYGD